MNIELDDVREKLEVEVETTNKESLTLKKDIDPFYEFECELDG